MATVRTPRWVEAKNALLANISSGEWAPGERLLAEPMLAAELGVSRATLREALRSLAEDGYLQRTPGAGTRIANRAVLTNSLDNNIGVAHTIRSMGMMPGTSSLEFHLAEAPDDVARDLGLSERSRIAVIERVRTADGNPVVFSTHFYPPQRHWNEGALLAGFDDESLYTLLETRAGIRIQHATATIAPAIADDNLAMRLATSGGALLLHIRQVDFDTHGTPVIVSSEYFRNDAFQFTIFRRGPGSPGPSPASNPIAGRRAQGKVSAPG